MFAGEYQTKERMEKKLKAIPLPDLTGKSVLDIGCDHGFWSWHSAKAGSSKVVGLDRNRKVKGVGLVDLIERNNSKARSEGLPCEFFNINLGQQWLNFGKFDVIYLFSLYHHIFEQCADHSSIWFWLYRHCHSDSELLWENPTSVDDTVVRRNVSSGNHDQYNSKAIIAAASCYFEVEYIGPAIHEPTREVWRLKPKEVSSQPYKGTVKSGAGGASKAFVYAESRRIKEFINILGIEPVPGSLNATLTSEFDWDVGYYRAKVLDVLNRKAGLNSEWGLRWSRIYPVTVNGVEAFAFRFEGEKYSERFIELISNERLRGHVKKDNLIWVKHL